MSDSIFSAEHAERRASVPRGLPLIVALQGLSDAGGAISQLDEYLWEQCHPEEILRFNADLLLDYRARRPIITFDSDHFTDYSPEELTLSLARDELGTPFLLLSGYEPDFRWEQFIDAVLMLVHEFEVSITTWSHAIPMPVPHTRPISMTVSGSREDLIEARSSWRPTTKLSASAAHVLEYRLHSLGEEVAGFALLIPHYLANTEYPEALYAALDGLMAATGLIFATDEVRTRARAFMEQVDAQISESHETAEMVHTLEKRYDAYMEDQEIRSPLVSEDGSLPTAEQIASELERFLAQQHGSGDSGFHDPDHPEPGDDTPGGESDNNH
ncbi:proteasome assembly chaperone family protein [Leucobacter sp. HY1908]